MTRSPFAAQDNKQSFSLGSLFLLITLAAVFIAVLAPIAQTDIVPERELVWFTYVTFGVVGIPFGILIGLHHHARLRGALWGGFMGVVVASIAALLWYGVVTSPSHGLRLTLVGCVALITVSIVFFHLNQKDPSLANESFEGFLERW